MNEINSNQNDQNLNQIEKVKNYIFDWRFGLSNIIYSLAVCGLYSNQLNIYNLIYLFIFINSGSFLYYYFIESNNLISKKVLRIIFLFFALTCLVLIFLLFPIR
jgi:hypothetical protein